MAERTIVAAIEKQSWLDRIAEPLHRPLQAVLAKVPALRSLLEGTWLGHPAHAAASDVPIGLWTAAQLLDLGVVRGRGTERTADRLHALGVASALVVATFGLADWTWTEGRPRRLALTHGLTNVTITGLYTASLVSRARGKRRLGKTLSSIGYGMLIFSAWLGGELVYRHGVGVNRTAFTKGPRQWTDAGRASPMREGELRRIEADGVPIVLARHRGRLRAIGDTCTHMGCSLAEGKLEGDRVICDCHGSQFRITDGKVVGGPANVSEPAFEARERDGRFEIRSAELRTGDSATERPSFA